MTDSSQLAHRLFAARRIVIMSAPNGARRMPRDHAQLPVTPGQLASCAMSLLNESVAILHLHVRDKELRHTIDPNRYYEAIAAVKKAVGDDMIVQITTESVGLFARDEQMLVVREVRPEAVSLALRELCPDESTEPEAAQFFSWLVRENIWPQYILYSVEELLRFDQLRRKGFFNDDHPFCMLVLGRYANDQDGEVADLIEMLAATDCSAFPWSVCCFGNNENEAALYAAASGGHIRLGFENNVLLPDGTEAIDNAALIAGFHASCDDKTRQPATADEIREQWLAA